MPSVRDTFFNTVYRMIQSEEDIYIVSADIGAPSLDDLRLYYPEHFINVGIAEQSLISISAGLIKAGKKVVAYGLNPFPVTRAYDQIRCLMGELNIPLILCALNAGLCSANAGYTHMAIEVFGMMRMLPNICIFNPSDLVMAEMLAENVIANEKPCYILFDKAINENFYQKETLNFNKGYYIYQPIKKSKIGIITNGCYVSIIRKIANILAERSISVKVFDLFKLPVDKECFIEDIRKCSYIITIEENVLQGGLGSYILEIISDNQLDIPVKRMGINFDNGIPNVFMSCDYIRESQGLTKDSIIEVINEIAIKLRNSNEK